MVKTKTFINTIQKLFSSNGKYYHYLRNYIVPENIFLIFCLFWGILLVFINPLFQGFDESEHFYKIYAFSDGTLNFKKITSYTDGIFMFKDPKTFSAQIIPVSIVRIAVESKALNPYIDENKIKHPPNKIKFSTIKQQSQYNLDKNFKTLVVHMIPSYTIVSYLPHTILLTLMKQLDTKPVFMIFLLRLCSLFLYTALIYTAIKITPVKKYLFLLLSITPLSIYLGSVISTDHLVIGLSFLLIAYILKLKYDNNIKNITKKEIIFFSSLIFLLCVCKFTYLPMILLFFILPKEKFANPRKRITSFCLIFLLCVLWISSYVLYNIHIFSGTFSYYYKNTTEGLISIFTQPSNYLISIIKTIVINSNEYIQRTFCDFGFSDTQIHSCIIYAFIALIAFNVLFTDKQKAPFNIKEKLIFVFIILSVLILTLTANYIIFVLSPEGLIAGFKGRYLIPVLPLFFMLFDNDKLKQININLPLITTIYALFFLAVFALTIINRYYTI